MENETNLKERRKAYWRANLRILTILMSIWFVVSFGCGILFVEPLNQIKLGGFKFGFWMAQQGSIYVFVPNFPNKILKLTLVQPIHRYFTKGPSCTFCYFFQH